jgi:hypothetical protein
MKEKIKFFTKVIAAHVITYMVAGLIAAQTLHLELYSDYMEIMGFRPMEEINGLMLIIGQIIRGFLLGMVIWWTKDSIIGKKMALLKLWTILIILGIFNTYGPAHGSIEGFIYLDPTRFESMPGNALLSMLEVLAQPLLFSLIVCTNWKELKNRILKKENK